MYKGSIECVKEIQRSYSRRILQVSENPQCTTICRERERDRERGLDEYAGLVLRHI